MIVDLSLCQGCGLCVDECPTGAISLQDGVAVIELERCQECAACQSACPMEAIRTAEKELDPLIAPGAAILPAPQIARVKMASSQPEKLSSRDSVLPALGSALLWTGREVLPRLATLALDALDRRVQASRRSVIGPSLKSNPGNGVGRGGRRTRRRQRGRF